MDGGVKFDVFPASLTHLSQPVLFSSHPSSFWPASAPTCCTQALDCLPQGPFSQGYSSQECG